MKAEFNYLGHKLSGKGVHTSGDKVEAVVIFHWPEKKQELSSFCGVVKYYQRFLRRVLEIMVPLEKDKFVWKWNKEEEEAFMKAKELLVSNTLLAHYDPSLPLYISCDASAYGIDAVLEQINEGVLRPISYASRTQTLSEKNYSQIEKEGLAVVWATTKFHKYV